MKTKGKTAVTSEWAKAFACQDIDEAEKIREEIEEKEELARIKAKEKARKEKQEAEKA